MANYSYILYINEDGRNSATKVELRLSDSYSELIDTLTVFDTVTNIDISSLTQSIEGDTLNVFSERLQIELIGAMQDESASNTALIASFIDSVNNKTPFYCRLLLNEVDMFTGKFDLYTFAYTAVKDNQVDYLHSFEKNDYKMEFEQTGSNILKEILNENILTADFLYRLSNPHLNAETGITTPALIFARQGAYSKDVSTVSPSYDWSIDLLTQKLISLGDFLTELLVELKNYINTKYGFSITTTTLNADYTNIGVATPLATSMQNVYGYIGQEVLTFPFLQPYALNTTDNGTPKGSDLKSVSLWNNTQTLYVNNSVEKNNIFIAASSIFDNVVEYEDTYGSITPYENLNNEADTFRIKTSTKNIFDMLTLLMYNLSLNYEIRIDDNILTLNIDSLDEIASTVPTIYTGLLDSFEEKIKDESDGEESDDDTKYIGIANAYAFPDETYNTSIDSTISVKEKPLPLTIAAAYKNKANWEFNVPDSILSLQAMHIVRHLNNTTATTTYNASAISPNTTMFMKVKDYNSVTNPATAKDIDNGFAINRPADFFAPIGKLAYKVNAISYDSFNSIEERITYFQKRYNGRDENNLLKEATASIASLSDFSLSSDGSDTSPHNLKCGNNIKINGVDYFITSVERDFKTPNTKLNLIADGFFSIDTPVVDETDNLGFFPPPPTSEGEEPDIIIGVGEPAQSIVVMDVLAYTESGTLTQFTNSADYYNEIAGITLTTITSGSIDYITIISAGRMSNGAWTWTPDAIIYARYNATTLKMELSDAEPTAADGDMLIIMGRAISATVINIGIENYLFA